MLTALIEYMTVLLEYINLRAQQTFGRARPCHTEIWPCHYMYTCVSKIKILKVLSLHFNIPLCFTGAHDKLVDKRMFTTLLTQLKAAVLVKVLHKLFVEA